MSDHVATEERRSALDEFAAKMADPAVANLPATVSSGPLEQQHGAMVVAVRRDEARVLTAIRALAAAAGTDWYYRWPVKNRKTGETSWVEGPSIKLANDVARIYGNNETDCRVQDAGSHWLFYARFIDLETGYSLTRPFQQRKSGGTMGDDPDRKLDIAFQIGASKAIRNTVVNALQTYSDFALEEAKRALVDKIGRDIESWRRRTVERVSARVDIKRAEATVGRAVKDWLAPDIAKVIAMMTAVADGMATLDETFPPLAGDKPDKPSELDQFANEKPASMPPDAGAGAGSTAPQNPDPASATPLPRADAIDKIIRAAGDPALSVDERLGNLDALFGIYRELLPDDEQFHGQLFSTAGKVARGELKDAAARKFLEGWK